MLDIILWQTLCGTSIPISKFLLQFCSPIYFSAIRMLLGGLVMTAYLLLQSDQRFFIKKEHIFLFLQMTLFGVYFKYLLRNWSLSYMTATKVSFMLNTTPFFSIIIGCFFYKETVTPKKWAGLLLGFFGIIIMMQKRYSGPLNIQRFFSLSLPEGALFLAIVCHLIGMFAAKKLINECGYSPLQINATRMLMGGWGALITSCFLEHNVSVHSPITFAVWLFLLVFISTCITQIWGLYLLKCYSVTFITFTDFLMPLSTAFFSSMFLGEVLTIQYFIATFMVIAGLYVFYQDEFNGIRKKTSKKSIQIIVE